MWRALFLAVGTCMMIVGVECLGVDRALLRVRDDPPPATWLDTQPKLGANRQIVPQPWWPWSFLSAGAVTCIYSFTLPKKVAGK
jgi:hypothetical protein